MRLSLREQLVAKGFEEPPVPEKANGEGHVLRKIVRVVAKSSELYGADFVELECGHFGYTFGTEIAGCLKCSTQGAREGLTRSRKKE